MTIAEMVIEALRLLVVLPAKGRFRVKEMGIPNIKDVPLLQSNYRYLGQGEWPLQQWESYLAEIDLKLEDELRKIVKEEFGDEFDIKKESFSGYLGVSTNTWFTLVKHSTMPSCLDCGSVMEEKGNLPLPFCPNCNQSKSFG